MRQYIAIILGLVITFSSQAGTTTSTINSILLYEAGMLVYVYPTTGVSDPPVCHGINGDYYSFSMTRPMAKEYLSAIMSAQARNATIRFYGAGECTDQSLSETLRYLTIVN